MPKKPITKHENVFNKTIDFGNNNFLEISRRVLWHPKGTTKYYAISKGYYWNNEKKYHKVVSLPYDKSLLKKFSKELKDFIAED